VELNDIPNSKCKIHPDLEKRHLNASAIPSCEQETTISWYRTQDDFISYPVKIWTTDQTMITDLFKSEYFLLESVLISRGCRFDNRVLEVRGSLPLKALTVRKKKPSFTDEEKRIRAERARNNFKK
jgi:hypothetical protein